MPFPTRRSLTSPPRGGVKVHEDSADMYAVSAKEARRNFTWVALMLLVLIVVLQNVRPL